MKKKFTILLSVLMFLTISTTAQNQLKAKWQLVSMTDENGTKIELPEKKTITINFADSTFSARVCNHIDGKYSISNKTIKINFTRTTAMNCREIETERVFKRLVGLVNTYSVKNNELIISDDQNNLSLRFKKIVGIKGVILNGKWQLVSMTLEKDMAIPLIGNPITLNIDKGKIGGNGGCNTYGGDFSQSEITVRFSNIFSTKMWCDNAPTEQQYFNALEKAINFEFKSGQLILTDAKKENTLVFKRV